MVRNEMCNLQTRLDLKTRRKLKIYKIHENTQRSEKKKTMPNLLDTSKITCKIY